MTMSGTHTHAINGRLTLHERHSIEVFQRAIAAADER